MTYFTNRFGKLNEYKILQSVSLVYISLPTIIFILGWIKPVYSIPLTFLILAGLYYSIKAGWNFTFIREDITDSSEEKKKQNAIEQSNKQQKTKIILSKVNGILSTPVVFYGSTLILVIVAVLFSGVGGYSIQDVDYAKHNAFFLDLTKYSWPLGYEKTGPDDLPRYLNTYLAYYLPSALVGKMFGFSVGYFFSFVWVCIGLFITLLWISRFTSKRSVLYLVLFIFFGELAYFGWAKNLPDLDIYGKNYNYANWMFYLAQQSPVVKGLFWIVGSNHAFLANGPHHIFPSWICILMIFHDAVFRKKIDRIPFIFSFVPFVSAFMAMGLAPFLLLSALQNRFKTIFTFQNMVVAPLLIILAALFLFSNNALFEKGWIWKYVDIRDVWIYLLQFFLLSFGLYFILLPKKVTNFPAKAMRQWLYASVLCIFLFTFYRMGNYMDFPIKAYNPSWIIFQVCIISGISYTVTFIDRIRVSILILLLVVGSMGAFSNFKFAGDNKLFIRKITEQNSNHIHLIGSKVESLTLFSDGKTFFWQVLAKKPILIKN